MRRQHDHLLMAFSYDGRPFRGVWPQPNVPTVSAVLLDRLQAALGQRPTAFAVCARTDAEVSANINIATVRLWERADTSGLHQAEQPRDDGLGAVRCARVPKSVHARGFALAKRYLYRFDDAGLDVQAMRAAAEHLVGTYDMSTLRGRGVSRERCVDRVVSRVDVEAGDRVTMLVEGPSFVRYQVRNMASLLGRYGRHEAPVTELPAVLTSRDPRRAEWPAAAAGLTLCGVKIPVGPGADDSVWVEDPAAVNLEVWAGS